MTGGVGVALATGLGGLFLNCGALFVGYGVLRGTVEALALRVSALEGEMGALGALQVRVAEIATRQETWIEQLKELNASIRWMREPAAAESARAPAGRVRRP